MSTLTHLFLILRATLFWIGCIIYLIIIGLIMPFLFFIPYPMAYRILFSWSKFSILWLKITCGVSYKIEGLENLKQDKAHIVLANHQSTWETLLLSTLPPFFTWVVKKQLLNIPIYGWGLRLAQSIPINRNAGRQAIKQIIYGGKSRLDNGQWLVIFPEGTRTSPNENKPFKLGGAILAEKTGYNIIPLAHNAGVYWQKHSYIKRPGTIQVKIGQPIHTQGKTAKEINQEVEKWIRQQRATMPQSL